MSSTESDPYEVGRAIALAQLNRAPRTSGQLMAAMRKRGVPEETAERVVVRMVEVELVDDQAYARAWVSSRSQGRGMARAGLRQEMRRQLLRDEVIDEALAELDPRDERARGQEVARHRLARSGIDERNQRRVVNMLMRRGFGPGTAYEIVRSVVAEMADDAG